MSDSIYFCIWMFCWYDFPQLQVLSVWSNDVATDLFLPYMVCTVATGILSTVSLHVICALWPLQYRWSGNRGTRRVHKLPKKQLSWLGKTPKYSCVVQVEHLFETVCSWCCTLASRLSLNWIHHSSFNSLSIAVVIRFISITRRGEILYPLLVSFYS